MTARITGETVVAGVVGRPVRHSLSPILHNAWIAALGINALYTAFEISEDGFEPFVTGLRGGSMRGLNVTVPYKERALALSDQADAAAQEAGAANLLLFRPDGGIEARNTDGIGLLYALSEQGVAPTAGPAVVLGAGGAARGAVAALLGADCPEVRIVNRTFSRAEELASRFGAKAAALPWDALGGAFEGAALLVNATTAGLNGRDELDLPLERLPHTAAVMDMVYRPLRTGLLARVAAAGHPTIDGLAMLIGQAIPSFEALFDQPPPAGVDVRALALQVLGEGA